MAAEVEIKLGLDQENKEKLFALPLVAEAQSKGVKRVISTYYDTPEFDLRKGKIGFRVRKNGDQWLQTVKSEGSQEAGLSTREEHEVSISGDAPEMDKLEGSPFRHLIESVGDRINPVFVTDFQRTKRILTCEDGTRIEMVVDEGDIHNDHQSLPIREMEMELLEGSPATMVDVAIDCMSKIDFIPEPLSKAARGYRLNGFKPDLPAPREFVPQNPDHSLRPMLHNLQSDVILARYDDPERGMKLLGEHMARFAEIAGHSPQPWWQNPQRAADQVARDIARNQVTMRSWGQVSWLQLRLLARRMAADSAT